MEDMIQKSDYERDEQIKEIAKKVDSLWLYGHHKKAECCFCNSMKGALIKLYQGWCCVPCFKKIILK